MIRLIKCLFIISILALWILSMVVLILSTIIRDDLGIITLVTEDTNIGDYYLKIYFPVVFPIIITVSCFIFVIGCVGCCGVCTNSQNLLGWFFFFLLVTFCVELSAGVWRIVEFDLSYNRTDVLQLKTNIDFYYNLETVPSWFEDAWIEIQNRFDCCGVDSFKDWLNENGMTQALKSCCSEKYCSVVLLPDEKGCGEPLLSYTSSSKYIHVMPYITCITGIVQVILMILTLKIWLDFCSKTNHDKTRVEKLQVTKPTNHNKESFYQLELDERNGCYLAPVQNCEDGRYYHYSCNARNSSRITSQYVVQVMPLEGDKEVASDFVSEETSLVICEDSRKSSSRNKSEKAEMSQSSHHYRQSSLSSGKKRSNNAKQSNSYYNSVTRKTVSNSSNSMGRQSCKRQCRCSCENQSDRVLIDNPGHSEHSSSYRLSKTSSTNSCSAEKVTGGV